MYSKGILYIKMELNYDCEKMRSRYFEKIPLSEGRTENSVLFDCFKELIKTKLRIQIKNSKFYL